jgi:F420-non-reducing hydrogenase small subunit
MVSALSSVIDAATPEEARKIMEKIADPLGTFYRFSLASSTFKRVQMSNGKEEKIAVPAKEDITEPV